MRKFLPVFWIFMMQLILFVALLPAANQVRTYTYLQIKGGINPASADYIQKGIRFATASHHELILIELDTPGGLLSSTKEIVQTILNSPIPVLILIAPAGASATSAGVFITMAAHVAAMAPGTSIGSAHPVSGSGKDIQEEGGKDMAKKVENYASSFIEAIANKTGRNAKWAIEAVKYSHSLTAEKAKERGVVDLIATDYQSLLKQVHGRTVTVLGKTRQLHTENLIQVPKEMTLVQKILNILSIPNIALLLLSLGSIGIIAEIYHPGTYFPGVLGGISFLLGLVSLQILPINYGGLALIILAILLLSAEFMVPSFGILGSGGIISFVLGALFLFDTPESDLNVSWLLVVSLAITLSAFLGFILYFIGKTALRRPITGLEGLVGQKAKVTKEILPEKSGKIFLHGETWNASSSSTSKENLYPGNKVRVVAVQGMEMIVEPIDESS